MLICVTKIVFKDHYLHKISLIIKVGDNMIGNSEIQILNELLKGKTTINEFEIELSMTKRQIDYSIKKINAVLSRQHYDIITRDYSGDIKFDESSIFKLVQFLKSIQFSDYYFNENERQEMIISIILYQEDKYVSLSYLSDELGISRNTIIKDINNINEKYKKDNISISYSRAVGYYIDGRETEVRRLIYALSGELIRSFHGMLGFNKVNNINNDYYYLLERIECDLNTKFEDQYYEMLNIILHLTLKRIDLGKEIQFRKRIFVDNEIIDVVTDRLFSLLKSNSEIYWFSLMIMSSSVVYRYNEYEYPALKERVNAFVDTFESKSGIYIRNKNQFVERLMVHLVPVVYRMLTSLPSASHVSIDFAYDYQHLIHIVSESLDPIEELIDGRFPETEVQYITMHVSVELMRLSEETKNKKKAALVSLSHGSMERILYLQLKQLFDDFEFVGIFTQRQFNELERDIDVVFTTVPLQTKIPQHITNSVLSYNDASNIVKKVYDVQIEDDIENLIDIIEEAMNINIEEDKRKIILENYRTPSFLKGNITNHRTLLDYLSPSLIVYESIDNIETAVFEATKILVEKGYITEEYAKELSIMDQFTPNYILGPNLMIPHIDRKDGAVKEGIMMYILKEPVDYFGMKISVISPLVIKDFTKHTLAISQLHSLAINTEFIKMLTEVNCPDTAYLLVKEVIKQLEK